ncbi:MAG: ATP-dependent DNA helicase RecG [Acidobacteriota bacterium]
MSRGTAAEGRPGETGAAESITGLKGVGPVLSRRLERLGIRVIGDLLTHYPRDYQDRRVVDTLSQAARGPRANVLVSVRGQQWIRKSYPGVLRITVEDATGRAALLCFGRSYLSRVLLPGRRFWVSGVFQSRGGELSASNFDIEPYEAGEDAEGFRRILPVYALAEGLTQKGMRKLQLQALERLEAGVPEADPVPSLLREQRELMGQREALRGIHFPGSPEKLERARRSIVYGELLQYQLLLGQSRRARLAVARQRRVHAGSLRGAVVRRLPFQLTGDQQRVLAEIDADLFGPHPGARLLQGEVGSGKTLVALLAAATGIEGGEQVALMAPTELLARQHADTAARLLEPVGIRVAFLSGSVQGGARQELTARLASGEIDLAVGTHALYSGDVGYRRLGLVIVDEQHRFGVRQRQGLLAKGLNPDLLLMTATPIPRTLALAAFGDLELSEIRKPPAGRRPVITHLVREGNEAKVYERVRREIAAGGQAYFVYPLIDEAPGLALKAAEGMFRTLGREVFPELRPALIHSRLPEEQKVRVMAQFAAGEIDLLVATSVMEVGVDVPRATCIVIEHAERFGLSSLHQLRGRVGRGSAQAYAFLVYGRSLTAEGVERLKAIMNLADGFEIAERDLKLRGPGEFAGLRQSGFLRLGLADLLRDWEEFVRAREDAEDILDRNPRLMRAGERAGEMSVAGGAAV